MGCGRHLLSHALFILFSSQLFRCIWLWEEFAWIKGLAKCRGHMASPDVLVSYVHSSSKTKKQAAPLGIGRPGRRPSGQQLGKAPGALWYMSVFRVHDISISSEQCRNQEGGRGVRPCFVISVLLYLSSSYLPVVGLVTRSCHLKQRIE